MKQSFVYILECSDNSYYTGVTSNLSQRIFQHKTAFYPECYTASRLPISLVYYCEFTDITIAIDFEKKINEKKEFK